MKELQDKQLIDFYIKKNDIKDYFENEMPDMRLIQYEPGEILNVLHPAKNYLKFLVKGLVNGYAVREDGGQYRYFHGGDFGMWGGIEFCGFEYSDHIQEAETIVHCLEIYVPVYREMLMKDCRFLWKLAQNLALTSYTYSSSQQFVVLPVKKQLEIYLGVYAPDHSFSGVDNLTHVLHCSRSQIQKVLREMMDEGSLEKTGKGTYRLITSSSARFTSSSVGTGTPSSR